MIYHNKHNNIKTSQRVFVTHITQQTAAQNTHTYHVHHSPQSMSDELQLHLQNKPKQLSS
jgi:hypothetical protein